MLDLPVITRESFQRSRADFGMMLEVFVSAFYHRMLRPGDVAIDAGTNAGMHFFPMSHIVGPTGKLIGFEANPALAQKVNDRATKEALTSAHCHNKALSNKTGRAVFVTYPENTGRGHLRHEGPATAANKELRSESFEVDTVRLDDVVSEAVCFIKCDLEGADFLALQGAQKLLTKARPLMVFENSRGFAAKQFGYTRDQFLGYFSTVGYSLFDVCGLPLTESTWDDKDFAWEYLAIPAEHRAFSSFLVFARRFWQLSVQLPVLTRWSACAQLGERISGHVAI